MPGDLVFIYESGSGRTAVRTYLDGTMKKVPCRQGRGGIVALVRVTEPAYQPEDAHPESYTDGSTVWWRYYAPTESVNSAGFIPRVQAAAILGYSERYVFRGFGEGHSGLGQIPEDVFNRLFAAFVASGEAAERERIGRAQQSRFGPGGEGPEHLALKRRICSDPASALPERSREAFLLQRQHGLSYGEIAATMGISVSTVEKHMIRALAALREALAS